MNNTNETFLDRIRIVLVRPKYPENIGAAVRAAYNMGISRLTVVGQDLPALEKIKKTATHNAVHIVEKIEYCHDLEQALAPLSLVVGTTARRGRQRQPTVLPNQLHKKIMVHLNSGGLVGLLFGPENQGLSNEELKNCGLITSIPTAGFSSVNLAQSVAIVCYELYQGIIRQGSSENLELPQSRPATIRELESLYEPAAHMFAELDRTGNRDMAQYRLYHTRQLLGRLHLSAKEAKVLKDLCRHISDRLS